MTEIEEQIDPITSALRSFIDANKIQLQQDAISLEKDIHTPFASLPLGLISKTSAYSAISSSTKLIEAQMRATYSRSNIDFWLTFLRRLPTILKDWPDEWLPYATLGAIKWSNWKKDTSNRSYMKDGVFSIEFECSEEDLLLCYRMATVSLVLAGLNNLGRWLGKGASVKHVGNGELSLETPADVEKAVEQYERRRPDASIFADEGILVNTKLPTIEVFLKMPLFVLGKPSSPFDRAILTATGDEIPINYYLKPRSLMAIQQVLSPYEEALQDLFGLGVVEIGCVLQAFSALVLLSFPAPDEADQLAFNSGLDDKLFAHKFAFMVDFCRKGFIRFPGQHLRSSLASSMMASGIEANLANETINLFFEAFCLKKTKLDHIDVRTLQPQFMLYASPDEQYYFDLLMMDDFLRWLIIRSKEWFSTQHGDRFTLALKRMIEREAEAAIVVSWKRKYVGNNGERELDLLVQKDDVLYAIECKAYAKSRAYWLGDPGATNARIHKIDLAVAQAKDGSKTIEEILESKSSDLPVVSRVEWVVCLPTQEYIRPVGKYGFLRDEIPRVCTPEELIYHFCT